MGKPDSPEAIARWAEKKATPAPTPAYKRLTQEQIIALRDLHKLGKTQVQIAETLGCDQKTVSRWLAAFTDTTDTATAYLRGNALRMAKNVVQKGQARDHIAALKGIGVLEQDQSGTQIAIGISLPGMPTFAPSVTVAERKPAESPMIRSGSDK